MMFLEFFIWGAWFVTMGSYLTGSLGFSGAESALAYSTQSWGAIIAPFVIGLIADKYVNAERLLGVDSPDRRRADVLARRRDAVRRLLSVPARST